MNNHVDLEISKLIREYEHIHNHGNLHAVYNVNGVWNGAYYIIYLLCRFHKSLP